MSVLLYSYSNMSESALALSNELNIRRINHTNSRYRGGVGKYVINWGASELPVNVRRSTVLNTERAVWTAVDKRRTLDVLEEARVQCPFLTRDQAEAHGLLQDGYTFYARQRTQGHDGQGLIRVEPGQQLPDARLYTAEIPDIIAEYRVTVFKGRVVFLQRKVRANDFDGELDPHIRTTAGGWGFRPAAFGGLNRDARDQAVAAIDALGLDFGGVDVVVDNERFGWVLEVNTAPQLTPACATALADAIRDHYMELGIHF